MPPKHNQKDILQQKPITSYLAKLQTDYRSTSTFHRQLNNNTSQKKQDYNKSITDRISQLSAQSNLSVQFSHIDQPVLLLKEQNKHLNVLFYENKIKSQPFGETIDHMHKNWWKDYKKLERDHSFIQWLFPNSFQSRFNKYAKPLSLEEAQLFKKSPQILKRYKLSYKMMLQFYGMKMKNDATGEINRSRHPDYRQRFYQTLLTSFHNHMRITRILTSLAELGFGKYAKELCLFLKHEIYAAQGGLKSLEKYNVYSDWKPFEKYEESQANTNMLTRSKAIKSQQKKQLKKQEQEQFQKQRQSKPQLQHEKQVIKQSQQRDMSITLQK